MSGQEEASGAKTGDRAGELPVIPDNERLVGDGYSFDLEAAVTRACRTMYPGYPPLEGRLRMTEREVDEWVRKGMPRINTLFDHPNRLAGLKKGRARKDDGREDFHGVSFAETFDPRGCLRDSRGVPVHPSFRTMFLAGAVAGAGFYYEYGPNRTADPIVVREKGGSLELLVIERKDTRGLALPGGMVDPGETDVAAAKRELREEAGVDLGQIAGGVIYRGIVADPRATLNAWPEATAFLCVLPYEQTQGFRPRAEDDASRVLWVTVSEKNLSGLFASHADSVKTAVKLWQERMGLVVDKQGKIGRKGVFQQKS